MIKELTQVTILVNGSNKTFTKRLSDASRLCKSSFTDLNGEIISGFISLELLNRMIVADLPRKKKKQMKKRLSL